MANVAKRTTAMLCVIVLIASMMVVPASATDKKVSVSKEKYITFIASQDAYAWEDEACTEPAMYTKSNGDKARRFISKGDDGRILKVGNDGKSLQVNYPGSGGQRRTKWFKASEITAANLAEVQPYGKLSPNKNYVVYKYPGTKWGSSKVYKNDKVWLLAEPGTSGSVVVYDEDGYYQVIYPVDSNGTYKMGWIKATQIAVG